MLNWKTPVLLASHGEPRGDRPDRGGGDRRGPRGNDRGPRREGGDRGPRREGGDRPRRDREDGPAPDHMPAFLKSDD